MSSPFEKKKVHLDFANFSAQQKLGSSAKNLSLIVNTECILQQSAPLSFLDKTITLNTDQQQFKKVAISLEFDSLPSQQTIELAVNETPCIVGLAENRIVQKNQAAPTVNDPQAAVQGHLAFVGYHQSLELQKEITEQVVVAVVDSGIDYNHLELKARMWKDDSGHVGYNYIANTNFPLDDDGHGTHVAGIIGAIENNSFGVAGLAGDYVRLMAVKVLDSTGAGTSNTVYNGIQYAILNKADVINISLESKGANTLLEDALMDAVNAGIVVAVATGNQSDEITASNLYAPAYIGQTLEGVMAVASVDSSSAKLSFYSNYSDEYAEISAPGAESGNTTNGGILSTAPGDKTKRIMGTSQATPMVSAAAAVLIGYLKTRNVAYTPAAIERYIKTDGSKVSNSLASSVNGGDIISLGLLANNIKLYFENASPDDDTFTGDDSAGLTCTIN